MKGDLWSAGAVCSLPYQAPAGMENLTVNKPARCFCTCMEGEEAQRANILLKFHMCSALQTGTNLPGGDGTGPGGVC